MIFYECIDQAERSTIPRHRLFLALQLKRFPVNTIKVDRSFVRDLDTNVDDRGITEAIIAIGKTLSLTVIAEGVETAGQLAFLRERHCDEFQGYIFSKAVPADEFAALIKAYIGKQIRTAPRGRRRSSPGLPAMHFSVKDQRGSYLGLVLVDADAARNGKAVPQRVAQLWS
jgi:hypothetical protein